ncbi:MAG: nitroreductase family protein [Clostridia bacterium]
MNVYDAIINRRSIRKFRQIPLERTDIERWINGARLAPQACKPSACQHLVVDDPSLLSPAFDTTNGRLTCTLTIRRNLTSGQWPILYCLSIHRSRLPAIWPTPAPVEKI